MTTDACLGVGSWPYPDIDGKHSSICDFVPVLNLPLSDNAGGSLAFSCMKNSVMFESGLAWREMNIWVTTTAVDLYDVVLLPNFGKLTGVAAEMCICESLG